MTTALWARVIKSNRIIKQDTEPCDHDGVTEALHAICYRLDLGRPLWLEKNERDWQAFSQTRFQKDQFMEHVSFDRLEIEFINPEEQKKRSPDPHNG